MASSADLLSLMSFFDRQGIPEHVLTEQGQGKEENKETRRDEDDDESATSGTGEFDMDLEKLRNYSFVSVEADRHTFAMHRLVQMATRRWLSQQGQYTQVRALFLGKLNASFPTGAHENWTQCETLFPHAKAAEAQRPDHSQNTEPVRDWAEILRKAGWYAWARGNYREAERMCSQSVKALEGSSGQEDIEISYSRGMLAAVHRSQGWWREAEELQVQVVETMKKVLGPEHSNTLTSMNSLALTYHGQSRWREAAELLTTWQ